MVPPSSIRVTPSGTGALARQLSGALKATVDVGPLPYGLRLTGITLARERGARRRPRPEGAREALRRGQNESGTARSRRCTPILRLTRCSALSTAFGSHSQLVAISS